MSSSLSVDRQGLVVEARDDGALAQSRAMKMERSR